MLQVAIRSSLFAAFQIVITPVFAVIALLTFPLPPLTRYRIISKWTRCVMWAARIICGIRYRVIGAEHIPREPCIILAKHQSAWETLAFQLIFPPQVWVLKRELLRVPFFGWGLAMLSPIAIDRSSRREALQQLIEQGRQRLDAGFCIVIFPEGTRIPPGQRGKYRPGGARREGTHEPVHVHRPRRARHVSPPPPRAEGRAGRGVGVDEHPGQERLRVLGVGAEYRDPGVGAGFNFSDAVEVTWCP